MNKIKELVDKVERLKDFYEVGPVQRAAVEDFFDVVIAECKKAMVPHLRDMISRGQAVDLIDKHFADKTELSTSEKLKLAEEVGVKLPHYSNTDNPIDFPKQSIPSIEVMRGRCAILVIASVGKDLAPKWWKSPNKAFDGKTPEEVMETDVEKVYSYLMQYAAGDYS